jgi:hypothetical protein
MAGRRFFQASISGISTGGTESLAHCTVGAQAREHSGVVRKWLETEPDVPCNSTNVFQQLKPIVAIRKHHHAPGLELRNLLKAWEFVCVIYWRLEIDVGRKVGILI